MTEPERNQALLFGGDELDQLRADTWTFDFATEQWTAHAPKASPEVKKLVKLAKGGGVFALWQAASKLGKHADRASVADALIAALEAIVGDLAEHGDVEEYGGKSLAFFKAELKKAKAARKALGKTRSAFALEREAA